MSVIDNDMFPLGVSFDRTRVGVGMIILPASIEDRASFIKQCYTENTVSVFDPSGGTVYTNCLVDIDTMKQLEFPMESSTYGSIVVFIKPPITNLISVIGVLKTKNTYEKLEENSYRIMRMYQDIILDFFMRAQDGSLNIDLISKSSTPTKLNINVKNKNKTSEVNVEVSGNTNLTSEDFSFSFKNSFSVLLKDENNRQIGILTFDKGKFRFTDTYNNDILINKDGFVCTIDKSTFSIKNGSFLFENEGSIFSFDKDGLFKLLRDKKQIEQSAAIAEEVISVLTQICTQLTLPIYINPAGALSPLINAQNFLSLSQSLDKIKSKSIKITD